MRIATKNSWPRGVKLVEQPATTEGHETVDVARMTPRRWLLAVVALVVLLLVASVIALFFIDEPLRLIPKAR